MTSITAPANVRDDLFTHIHKALRLGLFDMTTAAGRTDWNDPDEVADLVLRWRPLLALLRAHTAHEDGYILRLLDTADARAAETTGEQHRDLDDLLDELEERFDILESSPDGTAGLGFYRDLARFVAVYLPHLHDEETSVMGRIWACCTDEEIAATRARFMAATAPEVQATSLELILAAVDRPTRLALAAGLAGGPPALVSTVVAVAARVLPAEDAAEVRATLGAR